MGILSLGRSSKREASVIAQTNNASPGKPPLGGQNPVAHGLNDLQQPCGASPKHPGSPSSQREGSSGHKSRASMPAGCSPSSLVHEDSSTVSHSSIQPMRRSRSSAPVAEYPHTVGILRRPYEDVRERYVLGRELGRGQFGVIRLCVDKRTGEALACKTISKSKLRSVQDVEDVQREVRAMEMLTKHPAVIGLTATIEDSKKVYLIMELCEGGELFERITERRRYPEKDAAQVVRTLVSVVSHCQSKGIMHRDLKPENILLCSPDSHTAIKVVDFGLALFLEPGQKVKTMAGSAYYIAPEILAGYYGIEVDMWSVGVILYILLCGIPPFWHEKEEGIFAAIKAGKFDLKGGPWKKISEGAKDLVRKALVQDPDERITPEEVKRHPWILEHCQQSEPVPRDVATSHPEPEKQHAPEPAPVESVLPLVRTNTQESVGSDMSDLSPRGSRKWVTYEYSSSVNSSRGSSHSGGSSRLPRGFPGVDSSRWPASLMRGGSGDLIQNLSSLRAGERGLTGSPRMGSGDYASLNASRQSSGDFGPILSRGDLTAFSRPGSGDFASHHDSDNSQVHSEFASRQGSGDYQSWLSFDRVVEPTEAEFMETVAGRLRGLSKEEASGEGSADTGTRVVEGHRDRASQGHLFVDSKNGRYLVKHDTEEKRVGVKHLPSEALAAESRMPPRSPAHHQHASMHQREREREKERDHLPRRSGYTSS